jgi:hypothetical protein
MTVAELFDAAILVARHLKTADDLFDSKPSPRTESMVAAAVQWAERIMRKIDNVFFPAEAAESFAPELVRVSRLADASRD